MSKDLSKLEFEAKSLPPKDRARLVRRLIESLDHGPDTDSEQQWLDEAEKRLAAYRKGEARSLPADEVFDALLNRR